MYLYLYLCIYVIISAFIYLVFSGACRNSIHWLFSPSQPFRFYTFMNWGWVVSASTLRWWLLKTLPFAWKLLSATKTMPDLYHQALKCLSMVSTHDHQGDLKASLAGGVCIDNNVFANRLYCIRLCHPNSRRWIMDDGGKIEPKEERYRDGSNGWNDDHI